MYLNKALVYGNLTRDPDLKSLPSGIKVATFSVATNRVYKDKDGGRKEQVDFHNVVVFARQAEIVSQYLKKGSGVFVEGRMQTRSWDAQDGQKKYRTEIVADRIQFGPKGGSAGGDGSSANASSSKTSAPANNNDHPADTVDYPEEDINSEDIPF